MPRGSFHKHIQHTLCCRSFKYDVIDTIHGAYEQAHLPEHCHDCCVPKEHTTKACWQHAIRAGRALTALQTSLLSSSKQKNITC